MDHPQECWNAVKIAGPFFALSMLRNHIKCSSSKSSSLLVVDVLTVGSLSQWHLIEQQQQTWGKHPTIRYFESVHEGFDDNYTCSNMTQQVLDCLEIGQLPKEAGIRNYYIASDMQEKLEIWTGRTDGWMCAQRRPIIGLHRLYRDRYTHRSDYPDWLIVGDDDTHYNMDIFYYVTSKLKLDPTNQVHVLAGEHIFFNWPNGGFGVALSRAAIQRLFTPLYCGGNNARHDNTKQLLTPDLQTFMPRICHVLLDQYIMFEREVFQDGMSILDLMLTIELHRRPFCWHSDWYFGWILSHHVLLGESAPVRFPKCPPYQCQPTTPLCTFLNTTLVCHDKNFD